MAARPVVRFLEGEGTDARGRTVFDVISMNDVAIERTHDFIQWLFPLPEPSAAIPDSPVQSTPLAPRLVNGPDATTQDLERQDDSSLRSKLHLL